MKNRLEELRKQRCIKQEALATELKVSVVSINIFIGENQKRNKYIKNVLEIKKLI